MGNNKKLPKSAHLLIAQLAFANSDLAFQGNHLFQGNFYGVSIFDITHPAKAQLLTSLVCPGGQGDVSVYKNLLFMSVEMPNGRLDCGAQGFPPEPTPADEDKDNDKDQAKDDAKDKASTPDKDQSTADASSKDKDGKDAADKDKDKDNDKDKQPERKRHIPVAQKDRFRGVRIFDISDIKNPKQVAAVQTCRRIHTHTLVVDPNDKNNVYIYVSGTSFVRQSEELEGCSGEKPDKDPNTALFRIDVIKVPVAAPQEAKIVSSPRVFIDPRTGAINGLNNGGTHGKKGPEKPADTDINATTSPSTRQSVSQPAHALETEFCSTSKIPFTPSASMPSMIPTIPTGIPHRSQTTAAKSSLPTKWGGGASGARALPSERSEQVGRRRHLPPAR